MARYNIIMKNDTFVKLLELSKKMKVSMGKLINYVLDLYVGLQEFNPEILDDPEFREFVQIYLQNPDEKKFLAFAKRYNVEHGTNYNSIDIKMLVIRCIIEQMSSGHLM